jgi:tetratricopeptide (TPR) repeat protein
MIELKKAHELDIVELIEDLSEYGVSRGARGTVLEVFDKPEEGYMIEFLENSGQISKIIDWVKPEQIKNIDLIAKEFYRKGMEALDKGQLVEALHDLRKAINLIPSYIRGLHNSLAQSIGPNENWPQFILAMKLVRLIDPDYEMAQGNLAIAYLNLGVKEAKDGDYHQSLISFYAALAVEAPLEIVALINDNIAASYTALGKQALVNDEIEKGLAFFGSAHFSAINTLTRMNLAKAHVHYANWCSTAGDLERAIASYERAEDAGLMLPEVLNNHACALAVNGRVDEAIMIFDAASALAPTDETINSNLAKLLAKKQLGGFETLSDLITEDIEIDFLTPPMSTVGLHLAA